MATYQLRRGTEAQRAARVGGLAEGELGYTTDQKRVWVGTAAGDAPVSGGKIDVTYAQLLAAANGSTLQPGLLYRITDYRTVYAAAVVGGIWGRATDTVVSPVEPLTCLAISANRLAEQVYSDAYPNDTIRYTITSEVTGGFGRITYRRWNTMAVEACFDWRNMKFQRYTVPVTNFAAWGTGTAYAKNALVITDNVVYKCARAHTAGATFAADKPLGYWVQLFSPLTQLTDYETSVKLGLGTLAQPAVPVPLFSDISGTNLLSDAMVAAGSDVYIHDVSVMSRDCVFVNNAVTDPGDVQPSAINGVRIGGNCYYVTIHLTLSTSIPCVNLTLEDSCGAILIGLGCLNFRVGAGSTYIAIQGTVKDSAIGGNSTSVILGGSGLVNTTIGAWFENALINGIQHSTIGTAFKNAYGYLIYYCQIGNFVQDLMWGARFYYNVVSDKFSGGDLTGANASGPIYGAYTCYLFTDTTATKARLFYFANGVQTIALASA